MLLFMDSFDHYASGDVLQKWTSQSAASGQAIGSGAGRRGTNSWRFTASTRTGKAVPSTAGPYIIGFALKQDTLPPTEAFMCQFLESGAGHVRLYVLNDGSIAVKRLTTTLGTSATGVVSGGATNYIEFKASIHDSTGAYEVRVNGASVLSGSGADTRNGGTGVVTSIEICGATSVDSDFDDVYICDTTGAVNNDFLGDVRCDAYFPSGNGNSSDLVGSDANSVDNYLLVDEASTDGDTSYVESSTAGDHDTYAFGNMAHTPLTIHGVQIVASAKKDDAGARSIATVTRSGGADTDGATQALSTSYVMYQEILEEDPDSSAPWDKTGFDAAEFGVKVAA